jgi:type IV pilus assembly protein PilQ
MNERASARQSLLFVMLLSPLVLLGGVVYAEATDDISDAVASHNLDLKRKSLSFYFQNIEVRSLLQLIAKSSGLNFIISDVVKGNVTLNLKNVTWQQALAVIMKTQGLASRQVGNVIYISTIEEITTNETKLLQSEDTIANILPLQSVMVALKYATAKDISDVLKGAGSNLLSSRGQVAVDSRTNSLIIRDTQANLRAILPEIKKLDVPAKQVLIEARIVNIDILYEEQLGVRFGTSNTRSLSGSLAGANQLAQGINVNSVTPYTDRLNFNVPATALFDNATPGSIGLALAHLGNIYLDLELSALEGERHAKVIARPRVVTSNQQKAMIQTGEEIPYQESSSSGATSVSFKKAVLSLEIVPQITPDNKIVLSLKATQDSRGTNTAIGAAADGTPINIPAINTQEVQSNVLLNDNETIVIGGVYREVKINTWDRIPFFGTLPIVGNFFSSKGISNEKHELLIFITPKIITAKSKFAEAKMVPLETTKGEG